ncbi:hypothetical protein BJX63DRAFT_437563 [Aspergillus granulosus]|uniref:Uncharacterized protein n=1 Tax=Aspergillus granulosus TaxID=176169 RepID=A0ABR4GUI7_9EURO
MALLNQRLSQMQKDHLTIREKTGFLWHEKETTDFQSLLNNQVNALNLLLTALQCKSLIEQTRLLQTPKSRSTFTRIQDDASSLRSLHDSCSELTQTTTATDTSRFLDTRFSCDTRLFSTRVYRDAVVGTTQAADPPDAMDLAVDRTWNGWAIRHEMENLAMQDMRSQFKNKMVFLELGAVHSATDLLCRPTVYNETREEDERVLPCLGDPCDADADPDLCETEEWAMSDIPHPMPNPDELPADPEDYPSLLKRVSPKVFQVYCHNPPAPARPGWVSGLSIKPRDYPPAGGWAQTSFVFQHTISFMAPGDCSNPRLISRIKTGSHHDTEHIVELQTIAQFLQHATAGILIDGRPGNWNSLPCQLPLYRADLNTREIAARIMNAIGSNQSTGNFWLLEKTVNRMKSRAGCPSSSRAYSTNTTHHDQIFRNVNLVAGTRRSRMIANVLLPGQILGEIRAAIAVWVYLNGQDIVTSHRELTRNVRAVFTEIENRYNFAYPNNPIDLVNAWNEWHHHMLQYQARRTYDWVIDTITRTELVWRAVPRNNRMKVSVLGSLQLLRFWVNIYVNWNHPLF